MVLLSYTSLVHKVNVNILNKLYFMIQGDATYQCAMPDDIPLWMMLHCTVNHTLFSTSPPIRTVFILRALWGRINVLPTVSSSANVS